MAESAIPSPETILRLCAAAGPEPWYPSEYARDNGVDRDKLEEPLAELRMANLIELTEWVKGKGQGYVLTPGGRSVLASPALLARLQKGVKAVNRPPARDEAGAPPASRPRPGRRAAISTWDRGEAARNALLHPVPPRVVPVLLFLNFAVFLAGMVLATAQKVSLKDYLSTGGSGRLLENLGALSGDALLQGEWWRLLTCCFVHIGGLHLMLNMLGLFLIGPLAEQLWGRWRFLVIYLAAGVGGSWAAMVYNPNVILAGASGALWGMMTSLVAWITLNREHLPAPLITAWLRRLMTVLVLNVFISFMPGISTSGHFGGGAVGFVVASLLHLHRFGNPSRRLAALALLVLMPVVGYWALDRAMKTTPQWERVRDRLELTRKQEELRTARTVWAPAVEELRREFERVYGGGVEALVNTPPAERDPGAVAEARRELAAIRDRANEELQKAIRLDPDEDETAQMAWGASMAQFGAYANLAILLEQRLAQGEQWKGEKALREAWRDRDRAEKLWNMLPR